MRRFQLLRRSSCWLSNHVVFRIHSAESLIFLGARLEYAIPQIDYHSDYFQVQFFGQDSLYIFPFYLVKLKSLPTEKAGWCLDFRCAFA